MNKTRKEKITRISVIALIAVLFVAAIIPALASYSNKVNKNISDNLIRLHVVANSDSSKDQEVKLKVRDRILAYMDGCSDAAGLDAAKEYIEDNIERIEEIAVDELNKNGFYYTVKAEFGISPFPTKSYSDVTLPAGNYQALKIVLGDGEGQNWWCVLFPPLCFVDATHGEIPSASKDILKHSLDEEEYDIITESDNDELDVKIKFKIVELFQNSKIKFTGMFRRLFSIE